MLAATVGAVLLVVGWYGVSGEAVEAKQIPYIASASIPGAALLISGAVLLAAGWYGGRDGDETARRVAELHMLLVEPDGKDGETAPEPGSTTSPEATFTADTSQAEPADAPRPPDATTGPTVPDP